MIMKTKDVFQRKWITDSITKRRYPFSDTFNDGPVVYLPFQTFLHIVHRLFQAAVHDPRIMLRHACGGMSEHDGHVLQGYIVGERDGGPESVPGHMRGQIFLYAAEIGDFLEVAVHFLVAHDRQAASFLYADRMFPVFLQYGQWNGQQRDVADGRRFSAVFQLDPSFPYPPVTEIVLYQVFTTQSGDIGERQTSEATKCQVIPFRKNTASKT